MKISRSGLFTNLFLIALLWNPSSAHAGLFDALRSVGETISKITGSHIEEFKTLVESQEIEKAAALYAREKDYFAGLKDDSRIYVDGVLAQRDQRYRAELGEARASLVLAMREHGQLLRWQQLKTAIPEAQSVKNRVEKLVAPGPLMTEGLGSLQSTLDGITQTLQKEGPKSLLAYGLFTEPSFSEKYPLDLRWADHSEYYGSIRKQLENASLRQLEIFKKSYANTLIPTIGIGTQLNEMYISARLRESRAKSYLAKRLVRERLAKEGWGSTSGETNRVLLAIWPIPQSVTSNYKVRVPNTVRHQMLSSSLTPTEFIASGNVGAHELVVFLRHEPIKMEQVVSNEQKVNSKYKTGTRRLQNPEYARAQQALRTAQSELQSIRQAISNSSANNASGTLGALAAFVSIASESAAEDNVDNAQRKLQETPQFIDEPVLVPYTFTTKNLNVKQSVITNYAIYDVEINKVFTGAIERTWAKSFTVGDQVRGDDPTTAASSIMKSTKEAENWINSSLDDSYDEIWRTVFSDYTKNSLGI